MIPYNELIGLVEELAADLPGRPACQGCGYEHNCSTKGCAILRDAVAAMEHLYKDCNGNCECCKHGDIPCDQEPCQSCFDWQTGENRNWQWRGVVQSDG